MTDFSYATDRPYKIVPKRDFGGKFFLIKGKRVYHGFVVTRGGCNIMPGATWFQTIEAANRAIMIHATGNTSAEFWQKLRNAA